MKTEDQFAICVQNEGYPAALELWKVYRVIPDKKAASISQFASLTNQAKNYLCDQGWFIPIKLPPAAKEALLAAA
ncbi:MAG TPA: hypothetical protein VF397_03180 [Pyrinomonadaceae bacterium]